MGRTGLLLYLQRVDGSTRDVVASADAADAAADAADDDAVGGGTRTRRAVNHTKVCTTLCR